MEPCGVCKHPEAIKDHDGFWRCKNCIELNWSIPDTFQVLSRNKAGVRTIKKGDWFWDLRYDDPVLMERMPHNGARAVDQNKILGSRCDWFGWYYKDGLTSV